jgi:hypothetical protein
MTQEERERELDVHRQALQKHAAEADIAKSRAADRAALEAEAERFARANGTLAETPAQFESATERWRLMGGLNDPQAASRVLSDPAKRRGVQVISYSELERQRQADAEFWVHGGRLPGQEGRAPVRTSMERDSRFIRESLADGYEPVGGGWT